LDHDLLAIGGRSIQEAVRFIQENYPKERHQRALAFLMEELAKQRLEVIKEIASLVTDQSELKGALSRIAMHWSRKSPEEALRFAELLPGQMKALMMSKLVQSFASDRRFDEAAAAIARMPFSARRAGAIEAIVNRLANTDAAAAISWVSTLPPEDSRAAHRSLALSLSAAGNIEALQTLLGKVTDAEVRASILSKLGKFAGGRGGAAGALRAADGVSGAERERMISAAIATVPLAELPELAGEIAKMSDAFAQAQGIDAYVDRLFVLGETHAVHWVRDTPPNVRNHAVSYLVSKWHRTDATAAFNWVKSLPQGGDGDLARSALARILKFPDRNAAAEVAAQISDVPRRSGIQAELGVREE
jgi:hypothetical protein